MNRKFGQPLLWFPVILLLLLVNVSFTHAEMICGENIDHTDKTNYRLIGDIMAKLYNNGELDKVICLYKNLCTDATGPHITGEGITGKEKSRFRRSAKEIRGNIYQYVALSYIALDEPELAEIYLKKLFVIRRKETFDDSWLAIKKFKSNYSVAPRLLVGVNAGVNLSGVQAGTLYSVLEPAFSTGINPYLKDYRFDLTNSRGMQIGIVVEYFLSKNLSIKIQPGVSTRKFQYKSRIDWDETDYPVIMELEHLHRLNYIDIPVFLKYQFQGARLKPYFQAGAFVSFLTSAYKTVNEYSMDTFYVDPPETLEQFGFGRDNIIKEILTKTNTGFIIGAGIGYDAWGMRLELGVNYIHGLNNFIIEDARWSLSHIVLGYYDVFDDMKLRSWELSLKVLMPISFKAFRR